MASMPANPQLPLFFKSVVPLQSNVHTNLGLKANRDFGFTRITHAVPLTVDEFAVAQRNFPIVFGAGEGAAPLALVGLREGCNLFVDENGAWKADTYIPAFIRRYPFMLAKIAPEATELTLCFDEESGFLSPDGEDKLFDGTEPTATTKGALTFCEQFEQAIERTRQFMAELEKLDLIIDGEVTIQQPNMAQPAVYRGFRMISEEKFQNIRGDQARAMVKNGMMGLIYAHLFSLSQIAGLFERQVATDNAAALAA